jgi:aldehyde:ferredoxin oxidoreductase
MLGGYVGKLLRVDLTSGIATEESLPAENVLRKYIGGTGLAVKILHDELPVKTKPLEPDNRLIFLTGPLTGTPYPCSSDTTLVTLNYNTGFIIGDSHAHGFFGPFLKFAGYDGIIIQGAARKPVYLWIHDGEIDIRDATEMWGKDNHETEDLVKNQVGTRHVSVAAIGPAGENLIHGAAIGIDKYHLLCKAGVGSIMGSKKLKAIAVKGSGSVPIAEPLEFLKIVKEWYDIAFAEGKKPAVYHASAARDHDEKIANQDWATYKNMLHPVEGRRWSQNLMQACQKFKIKPVACWACPIACSYRSEVTFGPHKGHVATLAGGGEGIEGAAGILGIDEPGTIHYFTDLVDRLGYDAADPGCCMGLAFELYESGLLTKEQTDGLELKWGNAEAAEALLRKITDREGFGKIFAEGAKKAAEILGGDAPHRVIHVKGAGYNIHDWRTAWGILLGQVTAASGGSWQGSFGNDLVPEIDLGYPAPNAPFTTEGLAEVVSKSSVKRVWDDCYGQCFMGNLMEYPGGANLAPRAVAVAVGWPDFNFDEALSIGHRVATLERIFNMKRGLTIENDLDIGPRLLEPPTEGRGKGKTIAPHMKDLIMEFYEHMGWEKETGRPTPETIEKLGLVKEARGL